MTSQDVIHSFFVPAFRVKQDVVPGRDTEIWFQATKTGVFPLLCAEYCGTDHSMMRGRIVVMRPEDYAEWLSQQPEGDDLAHVGAKLFVAQRLLGLSCRSLQASTRPSSPVSTAAPSSSPTAARSRPTTAISAIRFCSRNATSPPAIEPIMPSYAGLARRRRNPEPDGIHPIARHRRRRRQMTDALLAGELPFPPRPDYLRHGTTLTSWLTTTDHKRIAILLRDHHHHLLFHGRRGDHGWSVSNCSRPTAVCSPRTPTTSCSRSTASSWCGSSWCHRYRTRWAISCCL